jgi:hypothetical protein
VLPVNLGQVAEAFTSDFGRHAQNTAAAAGGLAREPQTQRCRCAA